MKKFLKYFITLLSGFALGIISIALVFGIFISGLNSQIGNSKEEELSETQKLMKQVKESGTAGIVSYALWELAFWFFSVPVCIFGYREVTG